MKSYISIRNCLANRRMYRRYSDSFSVRYVNLTKDYKIKHPNLTKPYIPTLQNLTSAKPNSSIISSHHAIDNRYGTREWNFIRLSAWHFSDAFLWKILPYLSFYECQKFTLMLKSMEITSRAFKRFVWVKHHYLHQNIYFKLFKFKKKKQRN